MVPDVAQMIGVNSRPAAKAWDIIGKGKARPERFVRAGENDPFQGHRGVWG